MTLSDLIYEINNSNLTIDELRELGVQAHVLADILEEEEDEEESYEKRIG